MVTERMGEVLRLAKELGLDFFDIRFEVVPWDVMNEIAAYGLPIRAHHWSYGRVYQRQRLHGQMGLAKIFEIVINNDPAYAFLLDTNTEVENLLITAHVAAHADFFKHNAAFAGTHRNMVGEAAEHAARIERYKEKHGLERVERLMDAAFALERHIDPHKGLERKPYPARQVTEKQVPPEPYADLFPGDEAYSVRQEVIGDRVPPHPERDLLWFLARYAPLEDWERDVLEMAREEAYYFYPQFNSKILNEGWASYWHAEIIRHYGGMTAEEMIDFSALHASVVRPFGRFQINPYHLGYKILVDVEERWNRAYARGESPVNGKEKLFEIRSLEDDFSFLRNYLTRELAEELDLYTYGEACDCRPGTRGACPHCDEVVLKSREPAAIVEQLLLPRYNYGVPKVVVEGTDRGDLQLRQLDTAYGGLDLHYAEKTLAYIFELWRRPVSIVTVDQAGSDATLSYDERGFHVVTRARPVPR